MQGFYDFFPSEHSEKNSSLTLEKEKSYPSKSFSLESFKYSHAQFQITQFTTQVQLVNPCFSQVLVAQLIPDYFWIIWVPYQIQEFGGYCQNNASKCTLFSNLKLPPFNFNSGLNFRTISNAPQIIIKIFYQFNILVFKITIQLQTRFELFRKIKL